MILFDSLIIILCITGLWGGAVWIVDSAAHIAKRLGLSELIIGLTVVAVATSAPEFAVTVSAAIAGKSAISVGNVVGSNIFNLGIILGLVTLFGTVKIAKEFVYRDGSLLLAVSILLVIFYRDLVLSFFEGLLLAITLILYIIFLIKQKSTHHEELPAGNFRWYDILKLVVGVGLIIFCADRLVDSASNIARILGVSEWMIGITIVAAGTSIPELATSVVALSKGRRGISIGNLIGSDLFNMLGVLGTAAIIRDLPIVEPDFLSIVFLASNVMLLIILMRIGWNLTKIEGSILIFIALARWWAVAYL